MKNIIITLLFRGLAFVILSAPYSLHSASVIEASGTLSLAFVSQNMSQTNLYQVTIRRAIDTKPRYEIVLKSNDTNNELFGSTVETIWVAHYSRKEHSAADNTAMFKLYAGSRPFDSRPMEHIWFAFFGRNLPSSETEPFRDPGLCMAEPVLFTHWEILPSATSPQIAKWHNESADTKGYSRNRIQGEFTWQKQKKISPTLIVPSLSTMKISLITSDGDVDQYSMSRLEISSFTILDTPVRSGPQVKGRAPVYDFRRSDNWERKSIEYEIYDGKIPSITSTTVDTAYTVKYPYDSSNKTTFWMVVIVSGCGFVALLVVLKKNNKRN